MISVVKEDDIGNVSDKGSVLAFGVRSNGNMYTK